MAPQVRGNLVGVILFAIVLLNVYILIELRSLTRAPAVAPVFASTQVSLNGLARHAPVYLGGYRVNCHVPEHNVEMFFDTRDTGIMIHLCGGSTWEAGITSVFRRTVKPGWTVVDAGANFGWYTATLARSVEGNGKVISIEANPSTHDMLSTMVELAGWRNNRVHVTHAALGVENDGFALFSDMPERSLNNHVVTEEEAANMITHKVPQRTLDSLLGGEPKIDFIKIDVEGAEERVWDGMQTVLTRHAAVVLVMEVNTVRLGQRAAPFYAKIQAHFPRMKYIDDHGAILPITQKQMLQNVQEDTMMFLTNSM